MYKFQLVFVALAFALLVSCSSTQVGLRENWIDERDMMALMGAPMDEWMQKVGRPTLVEISGDTSIYYYNYRPTLYISAIYANGKTEETKPALANATEVWGSRKNLMQIKVVQNIAVFATVAAGPDKKDFVRDLNGNLVIDPKSGYTPNYSEEVKVKGDFDEFIKEYSRLNVKTEPEAVSAPESAAAPADSAATNAAPEGSPAPTDSAAIHAAAPEGQHAPADTSAAHKQHEPAAAHHADSTAAGAAHAAPASPAHPANVPANPAAHVPAAPAVPAAQPAAPAPAAHAPAAVPAPAAAAPHAPAAAPATPAPAAPAAPRK